MVSDPRSLTHFEFTFVNDERKCSSLILLHVAVPFSKQRLLQRLSFPCHALLLRLLRMNRPHLCGSVSGLSILF